jgi:prephenate dehydratase
MSLSAPFDAAYQGAPGAFSEEAATAVLGATARLLACDRFEEVFDALDAGGARRAVVPVENTLAGPIVAVRALLAARDVRVTGEMRLRIAHALVAPAGATLDTLRRVRSHPVALAQCRGFFARHPHLTPVEDYDTAGAVARVVSAGARDEAAIGSLRAAALYGGTVLASEIQDTRDNFTRFFLVENSRG